MGNLTDLSVDVLVPTFSEENCRYHLVQRSKHPTKYNFRRTYRAKDKFSQAYPKDKFRQAYNAKVEFRQIYRAKGKFRQAYNAKDKFRQTYHAKDKFCQAHNAKDEFCQTYRAKGKFRQTYCAKSHAGFAWYSGLINPLQSGVAYLYPLKTSENLKLYLTILSHSKYSLRKLL